jgi:hypothetical protein
MIATVTVTSVRVLCKQRRGRCDRDSVARAARVRASHRDAGASAHRGPAAASESTVTAVVAAGNLTAYYTSQGR